MAAFGSLIGITVQNHLSDGVELVRSVDGDTVTEDFPKFVRVVRNGLQVLDVVVSFSGNSEKKPLDSVVVAVEITRIWWLKLYYLSQRV